MIKEFVIALRATGATLVLLGLIYPLAVTGLAQIAFPAKANGSLIQDERGHTVGSARIGQNFSRPEYLQGRLSAAGNGFDATASSGSNLGPTSKKLRDRVEGDIARLHAENPDSPLPIPADLLTSSASGLDGDVGVSAAFWQVARVAKARGIAPQRVRQAIADQIQPRDLGVLGEPRINVLLVNLALDHQFGRSSPVAGP